MRNITVSVDEQTHRLARIRAAEMDTSVSALVRDYLKSLVADRASTVASGPSVEEEVERRLRTLHEVIEKITANGGGFGCGEPLHGYGVTTDARRTPQNRQKSTQSKRR